ncbi:hypothetical protein LZ32DRAFT_656138 [Colletotrichum eremochloae]|nr:hypothetical protein LZ32DRAFT_656138 [Colletotrichum eremochloae]
MKFRSVSIAAIIAALSAVQAAPLNARSSDLAMNLAPRNEMEHYDRRGKNGGVRTIGEELEDNKRKAAEAAKLGIPADRRSMDKNDRRGETLEQEFEEEQELGDEKGEAVDRRETAAQEFEEEVELGNEKGEAIDRRSMEKNDRRGETLEQEFEEDQELADEKGEAVDKKLKVRSGPSTAEAATLDDRAVDKKTKATLDKIRAGVALSPPQED